MTWPEPHWNSQTPRNWPRDEKQQRHHERICDDRTRRRCKRAWGIPEISRLDDISMYRMAFLDLILSLRAQTRQKRRRLLWLLSFGRSPRIATTASDMARHLQRRPTKTIFQHVDLALYHCLLSTTIPFQKNFLQADCICAFKNAMGHGVTTRWSVNHVVHQIAMTHLIKRDPLTHLLSILYCTYTYFANEYEWS